MRRLALVMIATVLAGCPRSTGSSTASGDATGALTIPVGADTLAAVRALERKADAGDVHAAWDRAHYLLDLFDDARFRGDDDSRALLWQALGGAPEPARGADATDRALEILVGEVEEVLALDRLHRGASAARVMLEIDRAPRGADPEQLRRVLELKAATRVESVTGNGVARLAGYCIRALDDATRGTTAHRARALSHCLYPLYGADPAPYFAAADSRPPLPRWQDLVDETDRLLGSSLSQVDRLRPALESLRARLAGVRARAGELPTEPDVEALGLPAVEHAPPYDFTPLANGDASAMVGPLEGDGRGVLALALPADASRADLDRALANARAAGASGVDLLVRISQTLDIPDGDYWAKRGDGTTVHRAGAVRIALSTAPLSDDTPNLGPRRALWDASRARLALTLVVERERWTLTSSTGEVVTIKSQAPRGDPGTELAVALERVRAAFADEAALALYLAPSATYLDLVRAASAAARTAHGKPLFPWLALSDPPAPAATRTLAQRIERRWRARVEVEPADLAGRAGAVRPCYQALLETTPELAVRVTVDGGRATAQPASVAATRAADCVARALPDERAVVTLSPR